MLLLSIVRLLRSLDEGRDLGLWSYLTALTPL